MLNLKPETCVARLRDAIQAMKKTLVVLPIKDQKGLIDELAHWYVKQEGEVVLVIDRRMKLGDNAQAIPLVNEPIADYDLEDLNAFARLISRRKLQGEFKFLNMSAQLIEHFKKEYDVAITTESNVSTMF